MSRSTYISFCWFAKNFYFGKQILFINISNESIYIAVADMGQLDLVITSSCLLKPSTTAKIFISISNECVGETEEKPKPTRLGAQLCNLAKHYHHFYPFFSLCFDFLSYMISPHHKSGQTITIIQAFFNCSSPFSVPKWKNLLSQWEAFLHWKFLEKVVLVGCNLFFILVLKIGRNS